MHDWIRATSKERLSHHIKSLWLQNLINPNEISPQHICDDAGWSNNSQNVCEGDQNVIANVHFEKSAKIFVINGHPKEIKRNELYCARNS